MEQEITNTLAETIMMDADENGGQLEVLGNAQDLGYLTDATAIVVRDTNDGSKYMVTVKEVR